jgi:hypothetical protein
MIRSALAGLALFALAGCPGSGAPDTAPPAKVKKAQGPRIVSLKMKAEADQLVQTKTGLWLVSAAGDERHPIKVNDGPSTIAEKGFIQDWIDLPVCGRTIEHHSVGLDPKTWLDHVVVTCGKVWRADLYFDLSQVVQAQIDNVQRQKDPRKLLGLPEGQ